MGTLTGGIFELHKQNLSQRVIASEIGRSKIVIHENSHKVKSHKDKKKAILSIKLGIDVSLETSSLRP